MYRPYQKPIKEEHAWIHTALRIVLITLIIVVIFLFATGRAEEQDRKSVV